MRQHLSKFGPTTLMLERLKGVNIVIKCRSLVDWPRQIDPRTYFHTQNVAPFPASASWHLSRNKEEKSSNFSNTDFSLKIEQIKVVACGKLHFTESFLFFSLPHDKSATEPPPRFHDFTYIFVSNYFFSTSYNERLWCRGCQDSRKCALQNIPSHASDMHICLHVSIATFQTPLVLMKETREAAPALGWHISVPLCEMNVFDFPLIFIIPYFWVQTTALYCANKRVTDFPQCKRIWISD